MQGKSDVPFAYNRKEAKDHGEGGTLVGAPLKGKVVIIDDVITAGTSVRESVEIIRAAGAEPAAVLIAMDRMERAGPDDALSAHSAVQDVAKTYGIPVVSIASLADILALLQDDAAFAEHREAVLAYRTKYGGSKAGRLAAPCRCRRKLRGCFRRLPKAQPCRGLAEHGYAAGPGCIRELAIEGCQIAAGTNRQFDIGGVIRGQAVVLCQFVNGRRAFCSRWRVGQQG